MADKNLIAPPMPLARHRWMRRVLAQIGSRFNLGDITIRHPFTGAPFFLHSFRHKGYWFYGRRREAEAMAWLRALVLPGATVLDIGAHIGYMTLYLANLVGSTGKVYAFEPGANNLPYLRKNCAPFANVQVEPRAVGDANGTADFYLEDLSGQNNSFTRHYAGLAAHERALGLSAHTQATTVAVITLDTFCAEQGVAPSLVKIDVEGAEYQVLRGGAATIEKWHPHLLVEMNSHQAEMLDFLHSRDYRCYTERHEPVSSAEGIHYNIFCLPQGISS